MPGFIPTANSFGSYGWKGGNSYNSSDIPALDAAVRAQFAYEWFDQSGQFASGRNPPFHSGAAGRLVPSLADEGISNRILRGFIRRADYDRADSKSTSRLYFMYNPEQITRDYVSYLDQGALDPFNTVFQSGNLVPPPSFMDFTFSLFFDRQEEARDSRHPGVFVDYEYFDLVVRNVDPSLDPNSPSSTTLPDNGVMMVNPRDITVVFSPQITVQGRPSNARVSFQRFTHRMVPTRMQIDLTMRVTYFGPMRDMVEYKAEEQVVAESIPWDPNIASPFTMTRQQIEDGYAAFAEQMKANMLTADEIKAFIASAESTGTMATGTAAHNTANIAASDGINASIVEFGKGMAAQHGTTYSRPKRDQLWVHADCSSFVWASFKQHTPSYSAVMTWGDGWPPDSATMCDKCRSGASPVQEVFTTTSNSASGRAPIILPKCPQMAKGDILFRRRGQVEGHTQGHVAFVYSNDPSAQTITISDAASPSLPMGVPRNTTYDYVSKHYSDCWRPMLGAPDMSGNRAVPPAGT